METAVAVEDQATAAVRQERKVSGDVKTPIVRASVRRFIDARRAVRMEAAVAIEHEARLRCVGARLCFHGARDAPAGPIRGGGQRRAGVAADASEGIKRVHALEGMRVRGRGRDRGADPRP